MMLITTLVIMFMVCRMLEVQARLQSYLRLQTRHHSSLTAANLQHTANQELYDHCGNQHHSREMLMMGIVTFETC